MVTVVVATMPHSASILLRTDLSNLGLPTPYLGQMNSYDTVSETESSLMPNCSGEHDCGCGSRAAECLVSLERDFLLELLALVAASVLSS